MKRGLHDKQGNISHIIKELDRLLQETSTSHHDTIRDSAVKISNLMREKGKFIESFTLLQWFTTKSMQISDSKKKLKAIHKAGREVWSVGVAIKRKGHNYNKEIYKYAIPSLKKLLESVEKSGTEDVEEVTLVHSWLCYYIAASYLYLKRYSDVCHHAYIGITLMKDVFREKYEKFRVVGLCHAITAAAWKNMKSYSYAINEYELAIKVFLIAEDMRSEIYRKSCINYEEDNLKILRSATFFGFLQTKKKSKRDDEEKSGSEEIGETGVIKSSS